MESGMAIDRVGGQLRPARARERKKTHKQRLVSYINQRKPDITA